jgi:hypothetical protein
LGHGQHFIGNGYRSLLLSDFGTYAFYLKLSARVWRLHYQTLFQELHPVSQKQVPGNTLVPKKYEALCKLILGLVKDNFELPAPEAMPETQISYRLEGFVASHFVFQLFA